MPQCTRSTGLLYTDFNHATTPSLARPASPRPRPVNATLSFTRRPRVGGLAPRPLRGSLVLLALRGLKYEGLVLSVWGLSSYTGFQLSHFQYQSLQNPSNTPPPARCRAKSAQIRRTWPHPGLALSHFQWKSHQNRSNRPPNAPCPANPVHLRQSRSYSGLDLSHLQYKSLRNPSNSPPPRSLSSESGTYKADMAMFWP